jgi:hypothetical protein
MTAVTVRRSRIGRLWTVRVNSQPVARFPIGVEALVYVDREMSKWYRQNAARQQFTEAIQQRIAQQLGGQQ